MIKIKNRRCINIRKIDTTFLHSVAKIKVLKSAYMDKKNLGF